MKQWTDEMRERCLDLRDQGYSLAEITRVTDVPGPTVSKWYTASLERRCGECGERLQDPAPLCGFCLMEREEVAA